jgi:signal transduction histidine kinase
MPVAASALVPRMPLQQILMNLIGNAIKHHHHDHGLIQLSLQNSGNFHRFTVSDDGPGIPAQFHETVFKMFQTLQPRDQVEGSGMGLAIVRKSVEATGGTISLVSSQGAGSSFTFTLPIQSVTKKAAG